MFLALYDETEGTIGSWTLTQTETLNAIIDFYLEGLSAVAVTKENIDDSITKIKKAVSDLNNDLKFSLQELLIALEEA